MLGMAKDELGGQESKTGISGGFLGLNRDLRKEGEVTSLQSG